MRIDMTPEEQREKATECGSGVFCIGENLYYTLDESELAAYTAAVEAKERARIADGLKFLRLNPMQFQGTPEDFVRSLK
jgi:hypothetical protein